MNLLKHENWRISRLRQKDGTLRKPKIYLHVELTSKGNLALNWYPEISFFQLGETDWIYWNDQWPIGGTGLPSNRLLMIHDFIYRSSKNVYDKAETYLLEALLELLKQIYRFLENFLEVVLLDDLYLEYEENKDFLKRKLMSCVSEMYKM